MEPVTVVLLDELIMALVLVHIDETCEIAVSRHKEKFRTFKVIEAACDELLLVERHTGHHAIETCRWTLVRHVHANA